MDWRLYVLIASAVVLAFVVRRRLKRRAERQEIATIQSEADRREPSRVSSSAAQTREVAVRRPSLPPGRADEIVASLRSGIEPDESWIDAPGNPGGGVRLLPFSAHYQSVTGESFANPDGVSRQSILRRAQPGSEVYLIPEPTNAYDPEAIAVYLDLGSGATGQIGYLPKGNGLKGDVAASKVIAWLAKVQARKSGAPLGAVLYVVTANS